MTHHRAQRRGLAIIPAMVCLLLVTLLCGVMLSQAHTRRGVISQEERRMQAEWLAESALARASARLTADRGYRGETWDVPAGALDGTDAGSVTIAVEAEKGRPGRRRVRVEADYPRDAARRARYSKHLTIELGPETTEGPS